MQFQIELLNVSKTTVPTAKGSYVAYEVAFKKDGKVEGKKIFSFSAKEVCKVLDTAASGTIFTVVAEKNEKGYWDWKQLTTGAVDAAPSTAPTTAAKTTPKGDWETKDERAARQVLIVKQSCLSSAINTLKTDKHTPDSKQVLELADAYVAWVFAKEAAPAATVADLVDDIPF